MSIIIVNYNTLQLTTSCIRSVIEHTKGVEYEIILVDNNSSECNMQILTEEFPSIIFIQSESNLGFAGGNNLGLANAHGEYILLLNSDTEFVNDAVSIAVSKMKSDKNIGALSTKLIYPDGRPQPVAGRFPSLKAELFELFRLSKFESEDKKRNRLHNDLWDYSKYTETDWLWGAFLLMPRAVLKQFPLQKLHEDFFMYYEDVQWCYFIKHTLKLKIVYIPEGVVIHHIAGSSAIKNPWINFKTKILLNQYNFLIQIHGHIYAYAFYLIKIMHYFTLKGELNKNKAKEYFQFLFSSKK
ncbi:glycosyltransferase [Cytophaga aurantiaca]|uniref:glycosyltransferase n=1 Tax=Cytophaga aurantiaca TaxID=29530 RepID=UPI001FE22E99|nr:glycosyltransferase [Cytophaga aurantiaca]